MPVAAVTETGKASREANNPPLMLGPPVIVPTVLTDPTVDLEPFATKFVDTGGVAG